MRVIVEVFGRAWMLNFQSGKMVDDCEDDSQEFEVAPHDPHSVAGGSFERRSGYEDAVGKQRFGFHGSQE